MLAHELRTPLNAILGWVKILQSGNLDGSVVSRALSVIEESAKTQNRLIEDIFDIARISSGNLYLNLQTISLEAAVTGAVELLRPNAEAKGITIEVDLASDAVLIAGDLGRMQQVVTNLLSNAIKFTPEGGRIDLRLRRTAEHALIVVEDNGQGKAPICSRTFSIVTPRRPRNRPREIGARPRAAACSQTRRTTRRRGAGRKRRHGPRNPVHGKAAAPFGKMIEPLKIWTIGHSTRTMDEFRQLLSANSIGTLADVRRHPGSREISAFQRGRNERFTPRNRRGVRTVY